MKSAAIDDTGCSQLPLSGYLLGAARNSGELFMGLRPTRAGMKIIQVLFCTHKRRVSHPEPPDRREGVSKDLAPPIFRRRDLSGSPSLLQGHFQSWDFGERFEKAFFVGEHFSGR